MTVALLSIDPGLRGCGVAFWKNSTLEKASYVKNPSPADGPAAWTVMAFAVSSEFRQAYDADVAVEIPRVYPGVRENDPNDLLQLAGVVGAIVGHIYPLSVRHYYPADWKGQVPKAVMTSRIVERVTQEEHSRVNSVGRLDHNTWDAVGIGLFHLGRMKRGGA